MAEKLTQEQFEEMYARHSGCTIDFLKEELKLEALPCECGDEICHGWQMVRKDRPRELDL